VAFALWLAVLTDQPWGRLFYLAAAACFGALAYRSTRLRVEITETVLIAHNLWRTHTIDLDNIAEIGIRPLPVNPGVTGYLTRTDGTGVYLSGLPLGNVQGTGTWKSGMTQIEELRRCLGHPADERLSDTRSTTTGARRHVAIWAIPVIVMIVVLVAVIGGIEIGGIAALLGIGGARLMILLDGGARTGRNGRE